MNETLVHMRHLLEALDGARDVPKSSRGHIDAARKWLRDYEAGVVHTVDTACVVVEPPPEDERCYYLLDIRSFVGNCCLWWRDGGAGYTTEIEDAGLFAAKSGLRPTDIRVHKDLVERIAVRHVRIETLRAELPSIADRVLP